VPRDLTAVPHHAAALCTSPNSAGGDRPYRRTASHLHTQPVAGRTHGPRLPLTTPPYNPQHKGLHNCLEDAFALERAGHFAGCPHDYADTVGKGHGRIASRRCWTTGDSALLVPVDPDRERRDWASGVWVESERRCGDRVATDVRIFLSSLPSKGPAPAADGVLVPGIENAHHRVMDVVLDEDDSRIRTGHAAHNMAIPGSSPTSGWRRPGTRTACAN